MTVDDLISKRDEQGNKCAICKEDFTLSLHTVVDHCHTTNKFRGFLCRKCNSGLGMFRDNIEFLNSAIEYLEKNAD